MNLSWLNLASCLQFWRILFLVFRLSYRSAMFSADDLDHRILLWCNRVRPFSQFSTSGCNLYLASSPQSSVAIHSLQVPNSLALLDDVSIKDFFCNCPIFHTGRYEKWQNSPGSSQQYNGLVLSQKKIKKISCSDQRTADASGAFTLRSQCDYGNSHSAFIPLPLPKIPI